ncbi:DUF1905 domain-containing protein [Microbacterium azadirachtae]|uniref:DUF1905 domain-containing protein n=1 Tax=Microbacterium azadirachtae TaxID=582680 RepID=A0A0F0LH51_9MICO|nr:DUF1905 domain-containing protein [Microbacterium azadirachtae]KJL31989.1 hypothetical protein RL72_00182 [Microbacterium azadirachtae]UXW86118.1 DUF1905 domain-containing protein [Microbacterium azadirachtae]
MAEKSALQFDARLRVAPEAASWTVFDVPGSRAFFGTGRPVRVTGTIDDQPVAITLMPIGNGAHVGPVKAATRAALGKAAGDLVRVRLNGPVA